MAFARRGIAAWAGIWLLPAGPQYDIVGGGITIIESRTRDGTGNAAIIFTAGHIEFRQSLLVRAEDAKRLARHQGAEQRGAGAAAGADRYRRGGWSAGGGHPCSHGGRHGGCRRQRRLCDHRRGSQAAGTCSRLRLTSRRWSISRMIGRCTRRIGNRADARSAAGGLALGAALAACLDRHLAWLTDGGRIGYQEWLDDRMVFMQRVRLRNTAHP